MGILDFGMASGGADMEMSPEMKKQAAMRELFSRMGNYGAGLAAASGPSRMPVSLGQAMAKARDYSSQMDTQQEDRALKRSQADWYMQRGKNPSSGSTIQAAQQIMQDNPGMTFTDAYSIAKSGLGQGFGYGEDGVRAMPGLYDAKGGLKYNESKNAEFGKTEGKNNAESRFNLPAATDQANEAIRLIGELRNHPGKKSAVGTSSMLWSVPGGEAKSFENRLDQIKGQQFLSAYESLKGGGQITEVEGQKAQQAIGRMNVATSEEEFDAALNDYENIIRQGLNRSIIRAGKAGPDAPNSANSNVTSYQDYFK